MLTLSVAVVSPLASPESKPVTSTVIDQVVTEVVVPEYATLKLAASTNLVSINKLCSSPSDSAFASAKRDFSDLVRSFSRVEFIRFGPVRTDNRYERMYFWPDRRGRGLKQVRNLIAAQDETALDAGTLHGKSVAVQGLLALDYILGGKGSIELVTGEAPYRCRYARAVASAILRTAEDIYTDWTAKDGFSALMRNAGLDNPVYQSDREVLQDLLGATAEQLEIAGELKLGRALRESPESSKYKLLPFWRSGNSLASIIANLNGVEAVFESGGLNALIPESSANLASQLKFELTQARNAITAAAELHRPVSELLTNAEIHRTLSYSLLPLQGAVSLLVERYPPALGVKRGFNTLDGD